MRFSAAWLGGKNKTGSSSQGVTVRTRGIFGISTTVGLRGFSSSSLYQAGTEICWAVKEHSQTAFARNPLPNARANNHRISPLSSEGKTVARKTAGRITI